MAFLFCVMAQLPENLVEKLQTLKVAEPPRILVISISNQTLTLFKDRKAETEWPISTARNGTGQKVDSYQTPLGLHRIKEKIGKDAPVGAIFEDRRFNGQIWIPLIFSTVTANTNAVTSVHESDKENLPNDSDLITSRILWLEGLEPGYNSGYDQEGHLVDSYQRYIYIHGTNHEDEIGKPRSRGCVRMKNASVISLFDFVQEGDLVWIQE